MARPRDRCRPQGRRYDTDHPNGRIVAGRCRAAGIPLVKLGIVDDGPRMPIAPTPN
ncbi:MAG TPA: hypothetical protein VHG90_00860 [Acidimicrobiales bacterium]|nr:hypothetical protein [Acidimicrobiales bacterium]